MNVIFLDIDGVLNSWATQPESEKGGMLSIHENLAKEYLRIIEETGAKTVLSSTWRLYPDLRDDVKKAGIDFISCTPDFRHQAIRGEEIDAWLAWHHDVKKYCIIDDDSDMLPHQPHFKTSLFEGGLTKEIANKVIEHFKI